MLILKLNYFSLRFIQGSKLIKFIIKSLLLPFWTHCQILAPILDILDTRKELETIGFASWQRKFNLYYAIAKHSKANV